MLVRIYECECMISWMDICESALSEYGSLPVYGKLLIMALKNNKDGYLIQM